MWYLNARTLPIIIGTLEMIWKRVNKYIDQIPGVPENKRLITKTILIGISHILRNSSARESNLTTVVFPSTCINIFTCIAQIYSILRSMYRAFQETIHWPLSLLFRNLLLSCQCSFLEKYSICPCIMYLYITLKSVLRKMCTRRYVSKFTV